MNDPAAGKLRVWVNGATVALAWREPTSEAIEYRGGE